MKHFLNKKIIYDDIEITDIFRKFKFITKYQNDVKYYSEYSIKDNETPELISFDFYNTVNWWWGILLYNNIYDPFYDWPLSQSDLENYVKKLVPDWEIDPVNYLDKLNEVTALNDNKKNIKIPKLNVLEKIKAEIIGHYK